MPDESTTQMNRTLGELTEAVKGLRRDLDAILQYVKEHNDSIDDHELRLTHIEDCQSRNGEQWKSGVGFLLGVLGAVAAAWLKVKLHF